MSHSIKIIYITTSSKEEAEKIACFLFEKQLIACANFFPIESMYWWKGSLEQSNEYVLLVKTLEENYELVKKEVENIHSYTLPCIAGFLCQVNENFFKFVKESVVVIQ